MYSSLTLLKKYIQYYLTAANGKGHGVHSPFVFSFIKEILNKNQPSSFANKIEAYRKTLLANQNWMEITDLGAGSRKNQQAKRKVCEIAQSALKPKKYAHLLAKIVSHYQPASILEMGTSLGITTSYLAAAAPNTQLVTMEGAPTIAKEAKKTFEALGLANIEIQEGNFDDLLPLYLEKHSPLGLVYLDGNHSYEPTMKYFYWLKEKVSENSLLIFDDIHWSQPMEKAWTEIKNDPAVRLTIDLFFIGLVFFRKEQLEKQNFTIRF